MKNKTLTIAKSLLLALTLAVMTFGMIPAAIADIVIACDGSTAVCFTVTVKTDRIDQTTSYKYGKYLGHGVIPE